MKLSFRIIFKIFLILTILAGCVTTEEIIETDPKELLNQGNSLYEQGQYDQAIVYYNKAIVYYNKALKINPRHRDSNMYRGLACMSRGLAYFEKAKWDKAIYDFTKAIEILPVDWIGYAYGVRGIAYSETGQYKKACSDWKRACELGSCRNYNLAKRRGDCK